MGAQPDRHSFIAPLFLSFRLIYIPALILTHTGHGLPYLNAALTLSVTFGMEYLTRRGTHQATHLAPPQAVWFMIISLLLLGLFPEEAPLGAILWAAIGAVWGRISPRQTNRDGSVGGLLIGGLLLGGLLGLTGLWGPGSWLMAVLLMVWLWQQSSLPSDG